VSALALSLLGLAAWLAERGSRSSRRSRLLRRLGPRPRPDTVATANIVPPWLLWSAVAAAVGFIVSGWPVAVVGGAIGGIAWRVRKRRAARALDARRDDQLADAVGSITAAIRAGQSVPQALAFAAEESQPPLRDSLERIDRSLQLGVPVERALQDWTDEIDSDDARLLSGVLALHRRSGGDLPSVLDQVAGTLRERRAAGREVRALTAQARLSGTILGVLPFGFFAFLWLTSRNEIEGAFRSPAGVAAITLGVVLEALAFVWIRRLLEVR
jgi:tight adherence protein B